MVLEEINFLSDHAPEPTHEQTAREFTRFYPESGWKSVSSIATHPSLKPAEGHTLSKRARLTLTVVQAAYGLARNRPDGLVIIVSSDQGLMQRLRALEMPNLCAIPVVALVQWTRTERKPPVVIHQLQLMRAASGLVSSTAAAKPSRASLSTQAAPVAGSQRSTRQISKPVFRIPIAKIFYNVLTFIMVAIAVLAVWRVAFPASFEQLWQQVRSLIVDQSPPP